MADGRGGRRLGAGRPSGPGWKPKVIRARDAAVQKLRAAVDDAKDPLSMLMDLAVDKRVDVTTRMQAASLCLPYLYPRLSEMRIDSKSTVTHIDAGQLLDRLDERIAKLGKAEPPPLIEAAADDDADAGAGEGCIIPPPDEPT